MLHLFAVASAEIQDSVLESARGACVCLLIVPTLVCTAQMHTFKLVEYPASLIGTALVDWLIAKNYSNSRQALAFQYLH